MKVLAFLGSPRKGGNSEVLLEAVLKGVSRAGGEIETVRLNDLKFSPCQNCGGCDETGKCILKDDMTPLYEKIIAAQRIILASPIYFYGITAQAKAMVDRTQALWNRNRLLRQNDGWSKDPARKGFLVSVAATRGAKVFDGAILTMKYALDAMGMSYGGDFLIKGIDSLGAMAKKSDILRDAEKAGENFMR